MLLVLLLLLKNKITDHSKYITNPKFNHLTVENFAENKQQNFYSSKYNNFFSIINELDVWSRDLNLDFTLKDYYCYISWKCVKLSKNGDPDKYVYSGYGIGLNVYS